MLPYITGKGMLKLEYSGHLIRVHWRDRMSLYVDW
jgi:hypothetical protein